MKTILYASTRSGRRARGAGRRIRPKKVLDPSNVGSNRPIAGDLQPGTERKTRSDASVVSVGGRLPCEPFVCSIVGIDAGMVSTEVATFGGMKESGIGPKGPR
ncbi:MAG: hypothetical protein EXQ89_02465 [Rhodospirillaceae bacterium]|nr:hypothetical protein [Rhodospirillaceae bacterium]